MRLPSNSIIASFCSELREAREFKRVTIDEVARQTCITRVYVESLESGNWEQIPFGYLRGYLDLYAVAVGMNREKVLGLFDRLMEGQSRSESAVIEDLPPLLEQPQFVEVTRSTIRTAWYVSLARHRHIFYAITLGVAAMILGLLYWKSGTKSRQVAIEPFATALAEYRQETHGPLTIIPLESDSGVGLGMELSDTKWVRWIGTANGKIQMWRDKEKALSLRFSPYDTIKIQYINQLIIGLSPPGSARGRQDTTRLVPIRTTDTGDADIFILMTTNGDSGIVDSSLQCIAPEVD